MFYPVDSLRRGGRFYLCWVADSWPLRFATITHRQLWSQDIREICNDLLEVMKNESGRSTNRFSLRLSSQLLRGLVRLYQRKVTVFVGDLCMINAHVMKITHKKFSYEESEHIMKSAELPRIILEIQPDEEAVEEKIQNSGNIVAHIEDITLREPILPENINILEDGFGELNPDQPLQVVLGERSVEMMLFKDTSLHHTALDVSRPMLDFSTDKSHDKSRLHTREALMERLSEHDISVFGKSMGEGMIIGDFGKEIPEIPDLPHPDPPQTDKELEKATELSKQTVPDEIVLDELEEEPPVKRRKIRNRLIIDRKIKLTTDYIRSRLDNNDVETRSEPQVAPLPAWSRCLGGAARPLGATLTTLRETTLRLLQARTGHTHRGQEAVLRKDRRSDMRTMLEKIDEEVEAVVEKYEGNLELRDISREIDIAYTNVQAAPEISVFELTDIADLPTQKLLETSQAVKRVSEIQQSPKRRRSGYISYRHNQQKSTDPLTLETNEENVPLARNPSVRLSALLQRDGLADCDAATDAPGDASDRTQASLGDSDHTTDSRRFIREEWGTQGAMHKIYRYIRAGGAPLDVERLVSSGPLIAGHRRVIAARCFTSILKLKQHGFIRIYKDSETYEIKNITLGSKIIHEKC